LQSSVFESMWPTDDWLKQSSKDQTPKQLKPGSFKLVFYQEGRLVQCQEQRAAQISRKLMPGSWTSKDHLIILPRWEPQRAGIVDGIEAQARAKFLLNDVYQSCAQAVEIPEASSSVSSGSENLQKYSEAQKAKTDEGQPARSDRSAQITLEERRAICARTQGVARAGSDLHKKLPAVYWGVTKEQVSEFVSEVRAAKLRNETPATGKPYCPMQFNRCGPNIHQVTAQFIKAVTGESAKPFPLASYALQKNHTEGMECDLFVSHCWEEGIFEFGQHVLKAWPADCTGAYICFLANPQNLDISEMVGTPQQSPFYKVLMEVPKCLLMVTNRRVPIHSRLWCCYEAFCAWQINEAWAPEGLGVLDLTQEQMAIRIQIAGNPLDLIPKGREREKVKSLLESERAKDKAMLENIATEISDLADERHSELLAVLGKQVKLDIRDAQCSDSRDRERIWQEIRGHEVAINNMIKKHMYAACH